MLIIIMVKKQMNMTGQEAGSKRNKWLKERKSHGVTVYLPNSHLCLTLELTLDKLNTGCRTLSIKQATVYLGL